MKTAQHIHPVEDYAALSPEDPGIVLDRIVSYTGSVSRAWGRYVVVAEKREDGRDWLVVPLLRSELPDVHWLHVREQPITPCSSVYGSPLYWKDIADVTVGDADRIQWWIDYWRPAVSVVFHDECVDCLGHRS